MIASYRRQRLAELQSAERMARFGEVYPIGREDYTREVTDASQLDLPGESQIKGTGVVCFLYKDGQVASTRLSEQLRELAKRHPRTKFVSIIGNKCIPNYADHLCPTLIIYRGGDVTRQVVSWGGDRERTLAELEAMLILSLAITAPPQPYNVDRESDEEKDVWEQSSTSFPSARPPTSRNLRANTRKGDSDSDFDL
ncbi:thioredoxin-like protein [Gautieria morchelliformis]|nr:thioredoxin-like protein [Gautieria morchelliformis]